jgi:hypothetical protein
MTPAALFSRCGHALCGAGIDWKRDLGRLLGIKTDTVDAMAKGASRIPPGIWRDIQGLLQDRHARAGEVAALIVELDSADQEPPRRVGFQTWVGQPRRR